MGASGGLGIKTVLYLHLAVPADVDYHGLGTVQDDLAMWYTTYHAEIWLTHEFSRYMR